MNGHLWSAFLSCHLSVDQTQSAPTAALNRLMWARTQALSLLKAIPEYQSHYSSSQYSDSPHMVVLKSMGEAVLSAQSQIPYNADPYCFW